MNCRGRQTIGEIARVVLSLGLAEATNSRIDYKFDVYRCHSIKDSERKARGDGAGIHTESWQDHDHDHISSICTELIFNLCKFDLWQPSFSSWMTLIQGLKVISSMIFEFITPNFLSVLHSIFWLFSICKELFQNLCKFDFWQPSFWPWLRG